MALWRPPLLAALALTLAVGAVVRAQPASNPLEEVDPDARPKKKKPNPLDEVDPGASEAPAKAAPPATSPTPSSKKQPARPEIDEMMMPPRPKPIGSKPLPVAPHPTGAAPLPAIDPSRTPPKPLRISQGSNAALLQAWGRWRKAVTDVNPKAQAEAQKALEDLRRELAITDLEQFSAGFIRQADAQAKSNDATGALHLASAAVLLSPNLPAAHFALAQAHFRDSALSIGDWMGELQDGIWQLWTDPRYARPSLGDAGTGALFALVATAIGVIAMLFARGIRYFLHDFHHLLPRATARWQSAAMAVLLLSLPVVFRLGLAPLLMLLFAASCMYLSVAERLVGAALLASLSAVPFLAGELTAATSFAGTVAEDVYALERNGLDAEPAAVRVGRRVLDGKAEFAELFALGRYDLRRGNIESATDRFKLAAAKRAKDARLLTNMGNAMMGRQDTEGAADMYKSAVEADPALAAPVFNLSKVYARRAKVLRSELAHDESDRARTAGERALQLDPALKLRPEPPDDDLTVNNLLVSPELPKEELAALSRDPEQPEKVVEQLSATLLGRATALAWALPLIGGLALFGLGFASRTGAFSRSCDRCGRPVCRRCDKELPLYSPDCAQCVNVFVKKNVVAAAVKIRKQIEVDQYRRRMGRLSYLFGLLCSGAGHLFSGAPIRGALYSFAFLFAAFSAFYRQGVLRPAYGSVPVLIRLLPLVLAFVAVYLLSLRGLYKRQTEEI